MWRIDDKNGGKDKLYYKLIFKTVLSAMCFAMFWTQLMYILIQQLTGGNFDQDEFIKGQGTRINQRSTSQIRRGGHYSWDMWEGH